MADRTNWPSFYAKTDDFRTTLTVLFAGIQGEHALPIPDEQRYAIKTSYYAVINVFDQEPQWLQDCANESDDSVACDRVLIKIWEMFATPCPFKRPEAPWDLEAMHQNIASVLYLAVTGEVDANMTFDGSIQFEAQAVTCFREGGTRRFIVHYNTTERPH